MVDIYRRNEYMWQQLAKIHLNGYTYNYNTDILQKIPDIKYLDCIRLDYILLKIECLVLTRFVF